jgi:hypothetical protein
MCTCVARGGDLTTSNKIVRIEQDWRIVLFSTDSSPSCSPQFITGFHLPNQDRLFQITWNHVDFPSFVPGGFQVQGWEGNTLTTADTAVELPLSGVGTELTWTQIVSTTGEDTGPADYALTVTNVSATGWRQKAFVTMKGNVPHLNDYKSQSCLDASAVIRGTNRVKWFGIVETRFYSDAGKLVSRDTSPKTVFQQLDRYSHFQFKQLDDAVTLTNVDESSLESTTKDATLSTSSW